MAKKTLQQIKERTKHLSRLDKLGNSKEFFIKYKPSQLELNIIRWFNLHSANKIAHRLKINQSYVYAVIEKFKHIYTREEVV